MKTSTDQDENGIAECQEQLIQQRMSAMCTNLFSAGKELSYTKQRKQIKQLGLCTVACIPEPVNDLDKLKQRMIEVLAGCLEHTFSMRRLANEKEVPGSVAV